jgi:hypothetical protein
MFLVYSSGGIHMNEAFSRELGANLVSLTQLRRRAVAGNDTLNHLFAALGRGDANPPTWEEVERAEHALEEKAPGLELRYVPQFDAYGFFGDEAPSA